MKKLDHTLHFHNLYVEGFAVLLLILGINIPFYLILLIAYMIWQRKRIRWSFIAILFVIILGRLMLFSLYQNMNEINEQVRVVNVEKYETSSRLTIKHHMHRYHVFVYNDTYQNGDIVLIEGTIEPYLEETTKGGFNAHLYYLSQNVIGKVQLTSITYVKSSFHLLQLRDFLVKNIRSDHKSIVQSFVFGLSHDDDMVETVRDLNLLFLMRTTGLHAYVLVYIIKKIMFYFDVKEDKQNITVISIYGIICYLNGFAVGVLRLLLSQIFNVINKQYRLHFTPLDRLFIVCFLMIMISFSWIYSIGLLMTFLILVVLELGRDRYKMYHGYKKRLVMSVLILVTCLPFTKIVNPVVVVLLPFLIFCVTCIIYPLSYICLFTSQIDHIYGFLYQGFMSILELIETKEITIYLPQLNDIHMLIYYVVFAYLLYAFKKSELLIRTLMLISVFGHQVMRYQYSYDAHVFFLDVGQGDTAYIETRTCKAMIDCYQGASDFLKNRGIYQLDYLFLTHSDEDHTKEADIIINDIGVDNVVVSAYDDGYMNYQKQIIKAKSGQSYTCGDILFQILGPLQRYDNANDNSLVISFVINQDKYLFTGDISKQVELELVAAYQQQLRSDILKVAHHGSETSTSEAFIKMVLPHTAVISVGRHNRFDFPSQNTLSILRAYEVVIHRTDQEGTVIVYYRKIKRIWESTLPISLHF